ncbi:HipA domain-containing protein [Hydrogenophaga sp.]|uniref:HipA domain-containing protein n=1 Tax=Hydrogenophaga sp. TaxID=1904254 RepID=UPI0027328E9A|nr:HipA domain-containing protein [Hydrogenophaga sp.]MDP2988840.1 HipA domain-containing protein [Hydrogenophaga sp.]MDP3628406.1 HipA domain-containing protein [Hydrogenophaga sp.]
MSAERSLSVSSNGREIGSLLEQDGIWSWTYEHSWLQALDAFPLSPALPLSDKRMRDDSTQRTVQWYFDNLLPEELMREVLSKEQRVGAGDAFGLLARLGAESAGALVLLPPGSPEAEKGDQPLPVGELSARIQNLPRASLTSRSPKRTSLAGAQHKMVVLFNPETGELREPLRASASSHILKPNSRSEQYPHSVVNETFTMRLARKLGVNVPSVHRLYVPEPVYIIERFDRAWDVDTKEWTRKHVIDACQLLNQPSVFKYSNASLDTLARLIDQCRSKAAARMAIFRWVLFNTLAGNSDSHLKNISFLVSHEGVQIAPFYDLLCTAVYHARMYASDLAIWPEEPLAIPVLEAAVFGDVTRDKLVRTGVALGLAPAAATREVTKMVQQLPLAADAILVLMEREFEAMKAMSAQPEAMRATQGAEAHLLRGVRKLVMADMLKRVA